MINTKPSSLRSDSFLAVILLILQILKSDKGNFSALMLRGINYITTVSFLSEFLPSPIGRQAQFFIRKFQMWCFDRDED